MRRPHAHWPRRIEPEGEFGLAQRQPAEMPKRCGVEQWQLALLINHQVSEILSLHDELMPD
jgi:hypothetical protein